MASLAQLPELVGFFSYSREDDEAFRGSLSALRDAIQRVLSAQLGRTRRNFGRGGRVLHPDRHAARGCQQALQVRVRIVPRALGRNDLVFPIHYILVPALLDEAEWRDDPVLSVVGKRQYVDWRNYRYFSVDTPAFGQAIDQFCGKIAETLRRRWVSPVTALTAAQERALKAGDSFKEGTDCPQMIVVPAGRFLMGSPAGQGSDDECPQHEVTIAKPFAVAKFALTFDEWDACAARGGCRPDVSDSGWGRGRRPVINVSWDDAQAYVKWLSSITGKPYRLLSEAEYEYAARAGSQRAYPWGGGRRDQAESQADGQLRRLRQPMG
jgi:hypothetical protein